MPSALRRKTPDELLREVQAEEAAASRGQLKIFLGYASGVGKSFRMLDEARRRRARGEDIVVGGVQPQLPPEVNEVLRSLEVIPLKSIGEGTTIDVEALIHRHPDVCVIDGLAYDNPPEAPNPTRWQDVQGLLNAGINVIGTVNIQYIAELREQVEAITGKPIQETVPVAFIKSASEIEIVDAPTEERIEHPVDQQLDTSQRAEQFSRLRELALVLAADVVDHQLSAYLERNCIEQNFGAQERVLVCVTPRANIREMMEAALTITDRFHGELIVAYVNQPNISAADHAALQHRLAIASAAGASIEILEGENPTRTLVDFARSRGVTQFFVGHSQRSGFKTRIWGNPIDKLIRITRGIDLRIFPHESEKP